MTNNNNNNSWRIGQAHQNNYLKEINSFLNDETEFNKFRNNLFYRSVIGAPPNKQAVNMFNLIKKDASIMTLMPQFQRMDSIGNPVLYRFDNYKLSPNLIRYIDDLRLIKEHFGNISGYGIVEFGCGFLGLASVLQSFYKDLKYAVIDLPEVISFSNKLSPLLNVQISETALKENTDLFIASFSLTELDEKDLMIYTDKYLMPSKSFYVRENCVNKQLRDKWLLHIRGKFNINLLKEVDGGPGMNSVIIGKME